MPSVDDLDNMRLREVRSSSANLDRFSINSRMVCER